MTSKMEQVGMREEEVHVSERCLGRVETDSTVQVSEKELLNRVASFEPPSATGKLGKFGDIKNKFIECKVPLGYKKIAGMAQNRNDCTGGMPQILRDFREQIQANRQDMIARNLNTLVQERAGHDLTAEEIEEHVKR